MPATDQAIYDYKYRELYKLQRSRNWLIVLTRFRSLYLETRHTFRISFTPKRNYQNILLLEQPDILQPSRC